jgi:arylsulfatase A-like enzyme
LYRAELSYLDSQIRRLYDALEEMSVLDETLLIVVGDHGENIGEHQLMDHQYCLYDTLLNVPLILRYPSVFPQDKTVNGTVEVRDLYPTVLELADVGIARSNGTSSNSLVPDIRGAVRTRKHAIAEYVTPQPPIRMLIDDYGSDPSRVSKYDRALRAIRTNEWKYIEGSDGYERLFRIERDPGEKTDRSTEHPEVVERLRRTLRKERGQLQRESRGETTISSANRERLENLGYL